jgi:predicted transcriptional regulator
MPEISGKLAAKMRQAIELDTRSTYALAKEADVSRKQLGMFLKGDSDMTLTVAAKLCDVLGLELRQRANRRAE